MSIDALPEINVDAARETAALTGQVQNFEETHQQVVILNGSVLSWDRIQTVLAALRAANIGAILKIKKADVALEDDELHYVFHQLRAWDQFSIANFLELCGEWVPQEYLGQLEAEAKVENKWFREWLAATTEQRVAKYPLLPWRSFIRKIVRENYDFAVKFLEMAAAPGTEENIQAMHNHIKVFLEGKKKVLCLFPKKWNKNARLDN